MRFFLATDAYKGMELFGRRDDASRASGPGVRDRGSRNGGRHPPCPNSRSRSRPTSRPASSSHSRRRAIARRVSSFATSSARCSPWSTPRWRADGREPVDVRRRTPRLGVTRCRWRSSPSASARFRLDPRRSRDSRRRAAARRRQARPSPKAWRAADERDEAAEAQAHARDRRRPGRSPPGALHEQPPRDARRPRTPCARPVRRSRRCPSITAARRCPRSSRSRTRSCACASRAAPGATRRARRAKRFGHRARPLAGAFDPAARGAHARGGALPAGQIVELDDGALAIVLATPPATPERPQIEWLTGLNREALPETDARPAGPAAGGSPRGPRAAAHRMASREGSRRLNERRRAVSGRATLVRLARVAFAGDREAQRQAHPERAFAAVHADVAAVRLRQALHGCSPMPGRRATAGRRPRPGRTARRCASPPTARCPPLSETSRRTKRPSAFVRTRTTAPRRLNFTAFTIRFTATLADLHLVHEQLGTPRRHSVSSATSYFFASARDVSTAPRTTSSSATWRCELHLAALEPRQVEGCRR